MKEPCQSFALIMEVKLHVSQWKRTKRYFIYGDSWL